MTTLGALYQAVRKRLRAAGLETPELDAKRILSYALGCAPDDVVLKPDAPAPQHHDVLERCIARRMAHEPVAKITGMRGFYDLDFEVTRDVLDPRPDTETVIDAVRRFVGASGIAQPRILDVCTGTGCIPVTLLHLFASATACATDVSEAALAVAARNVARHGMDRRMTLQQGNWLENVTGRYHVITCNPPYIPTHDIAGLESDVRDYDPHLALDGGNDGLDPYRILFPQIRGRLENDGAAFFEIGAGQADDVRKIAAACGLQVFDVVRDLGGVERVVCMRMTGQEKNT